MSIRLVDMQIMVQKTPETAKTTQIESQRPEIQQQNTAERNTKETLLNEERVLTTERTESETINEDGRGSTEYRQGKNKRRRERRDEPPKQAQERKGMFDVSI